MMTTKIENFYNKKMDIYCVRITTTNGKATATTQRAGENYEDLRAEAIRGMGKDMGKITETYAINDCGKWIEVEKF